MRRKYGNTKVTIDGIKFDSKAEAAYYRYLQILVKSGEIKGFEMQVKYVLLDKFKRPDGSNKTIRAINYIPDFVIEMNDGSKKVVDVKGKQTEVFRIKAKLFMHKYQVPLILAKYDYRTGKFTHIAA